MVKRNNVTALVRLRRDYMRLKSDPVPYISAEPLPSNMLEWHYVVRGPEGSSYQGGVYHGMLRFPVEYPFRPPSIYMVTPNGRFKPNTRLCLSISDFHPDTWNPSWSVSTILTGLLSFMLETSPTVGSIETSMYEKRAFARHSLVVNLENTTFCELFPDIVEEMRERLATEASSVGQDGRCAGGQGGDLGMGGRGDASGGITGVVGNLAVFSALLAFAVVVHYVITSGV